MSNQIKNNPSSTYLDLDDYAYFLKKKYVLKTYVFIDLLLLSFGLYFFFVSHLTTHALLCFFSSAIFIVFSILGYKKYIHYSYLVTIQNIFLFAIIVFTFFISGGLKAPSLFWIPAIAYSSLSLLGKKSMIIWLVVGVLIATVFLYLDLYVYDFVNLQTGLNRSILHYVHLVLLCIFTLSISLINSQMSEESSRIQLKLIERSYHSNRLESLGEIVSGVSHEINNPLAIADGCVRRLEKKLKHKEIESSEIFELIDNIKISNLRIIGIVKSLKSFYRRDGSLETNTNLKDLLSETLRLVKHEYEDSDITIIFDEQVPEIQIRGNHTKLQQVLFNLLSNARDALEGVIDKVINIQYEILDAKYIVLSISDNGKGVPTDIKEKILDPFFTTKDINKGTGLGLSIIRNIVKDIGGEISFESKEGGGTTFKVSIPLVH